MKKLISLVLVLLLIAAIPAFAEGGDLNGDGDVNVTDLSAIAAHVKGVRPLKEEALEKADLNGDGDINVTDLSKLAAHVKGIRSLTSEN